MFLRVLSGVNRQMLLSNAMATGLTQQGITTGLGVGGMDFGLGQQGVLPTATFGSTATQVMPAVTKQNATSKQAAQAKSRASVQTAHRCCVCVCCFRLQYGGGLGVPTLGAAGANIGFGGVGAFGAGTLGTSKKTTTAQPIYAQVRQRETRRLRP